MISRHDLNEEWKLIDDTLRPSKTLIWHTKRQIYHPGPKLPTKLVGKGYPISLNQTHAAILHLKADWICVEGHVYSFQSFTWTFLKCIHEISHTLKSHESFALEATSYFSKNSELQILIKVNFHGWSTSLDSLEMILIDGKTFSSSKLELGLVCNHNQIGLLPQPKYPNKATMVSIQSNIYFIYSHCTDEEDMNALDVYTLNGSQLQCLQRIRVNSSSALDWRWYTNDFYAISTLFWSSTKELLGGRCNKNAIITILYSFSKVLFKLRIFWRNIIFILYKKSVQLLLLILLFLRFFPHLFT